MTLVTAPDSDGDGNNSSHRSSNMKNKDSKPYDDFVIGALDDEESENPLWHHHLPANPGASDFLFYPMLASLAWLRLLCDNFGAKFVAMNVFGEHFLKGVLLAGGSGGLV